MSSHRSSSCDQHSAHLAWHMNHSAYNNLLQCTKSANRQHVIKPQFCIPICNLNHEFDFTQRNDFITMMEKLEFAPVLENSSSKVTHGISPLRFFKINNGELVNSIYYQKLNNKASVNTTINIEKAHMCQPIMPRSREDLISVLQQKINCLQFLFGI